MKNLIFTIVICIFVLGFGMSACTFKGSTKPVANKIEIVSTTPQNSMDWQGTYTGIVPCADCAGIFTQITLNADNTYGLQTQYVGKSDSISSFDGTFQWNDAGNIVTLSGLKEKSMPSAYQVDNNKLTQLDMDGNIITGDSASNYGLTKVDENLVEKKWKLTELNGVVLAKKPAIDAFITFQIKGNRVSGSSGCNNFTGTYKIEPGNQLHFPPMASTRKLCIDMSIENQMNQMFPVIDSYTIANDTTLILSSAGTSLAQFVLVQ